jgi:hypothetical protein
VTAPRLIAIASVGLTSRAAWVNFTSSSGVTKRVIVGLIDGGKASQSDQSKL